MICGAASATVGSGEAEPVSRNFDMKLILAFFPALAVLLACSTAQAQTPQAALSGAIDKLRNTSSYAWTTCAELAGSPLETASITGTADASGFLIFKSAAGDGVAIARGKARVLKTSSGWKTAGALGGGINAAGLGLLAAQTPPDEIAALVARLNSIKLSGDGSFTGALDSDAAKSCLQAYVAIRPEPVGIAPETRTASGKFQIWFKDGLPQKYTLTIRADISLPVGVMFMEYIATTEIKGVGSTKAEVPPAAREALEQQARGRQSKSGPSASGVNT